MANERGWWKLTYNSVESDDDLDLDEGDLGHISEAIKEGYVEGEITEEALWPTMPAPAWQYTLTGRCVWAVGAVWLAPLPGAILAGAAVVAGFLPGAEACAVAAAVAPWIAIALHERTARREQPWRAVAGEDGAPVIREAQAGRRFVRGERGGEQRWIPAEVWNWAAPGEVAEGGGVTGRLAGAVRSHLPALLGGQPDSSVVEALALEAGREARREARAEEALALRREAQAESIALRREQLALAQAREARMTAARGGGRR